MIPKSLRDFSAVDIADREPWLLCPKDGVTVRRRNRGYLDVVAAQSDAAAGTRAAARTVAAQRI